jgi:hypothetical protein
MKITIDTAKDSPEDIRKVVALLGSLSSIRSRVVQEKPRNIFEDPSPGLNVSEQRHQPEPQPSSEYVGNAFASLFGNSDDIQKTEETQKKKEDIEIVPY